MPAGTSTFGDLEEPASSQAFTLHLMDASGDRWTQRIVVALTATLTAVQAWIELYQAITQSSVFAVTREWLWRGDADPDNAEFGPRSGVENGINLAFRNAGSGDTFPIRVVAPVEDVMQGNQDIPLLTGGSMDEFILATIALTPGYNFNTARYTVHRERANNPVIK